MRNVFLCCCRSGSPMPKCCCFLINLKFAPAISMPVVEITRPFGRVEARQTNNRSTSHTPSREKRKMRKTTTERGSELSKNFKIMNMNDK